MRRSILFVVPQQSFRDEELAAPKEALSRAGYDCVVASHAVGTCTGMRGGETLATLSLADVRCEDYEGVVFVGGNGARAFFDDPEPQRIAREMDRARKIVGAICLAPVILARAGVLQGRRATVFVTERKTLEAAGAHYEGPGAFVDGHVVTADGPAAAPAFATAFLRALSPRVSRITTRSLRRVTPPERSAAH